MSKKISDIVTTILFFVLITGFMIINVIKPDLKFSYSERRKLKAVPEYSFEKLMEGKLFEEFEKYTLDQFILRDAFRSLKAYFVYYALFQKDNNKIYIVNNNINKMDYPLDVNSVINAATKFNEIYEKYLDGKNVYYSIIPDKNYFVAADNGYLSIDYEKMEELLTQNIKNMSYINIFDTLTMDDYYLTDVHWRQEKILKVADRILSGMGNEKKASDYLYTTKELYPFYGSYYGQAALEINPDIMVYLTNGIINNSRVYDYYHNLWTKVYSEEKFSGMDPYDVFLKGAMPLLTITNSSITSSANQKRELLLFRDSFGSSIAPLFLGAYSKITLIDLRYISTDILENYIDFSQEQDVLFLYNTQVLNNSYMLK